MIRVNVFVEGQDDRLSKAEMSNYFKEMFNENDFRSVKDLALSAKGITIPFLLTVMPLLLALYVCQQLQDFLRIDLLPL